MANVDVSPYAYELSVAAPYERAFDIYVTQIGRWWPAVYTAEPATFDTVTIDPYVGGRVVERHQDGVTQDWGRVTLWVPGRAIAYEFSLAMADCPPSLIQVNFVPGGDSCVVEFTHGGWNEENAEHHAKFNEWPRILRAYARAAESAVA